MLEVPANQNLMELNGMLSDDRIKTIEVSFKKKKRSLDANAALWKLLHEMAVKLNTSKERIYQIMLERYGVFDHIVVVPEAAERIKKMSQFGAVVERGVVEVNNKKSVHLQCYYGSSTYDSKEFAHLLDGVINDAKDEGIDFLSKEDQQRMIDEWQTSTSSAKTKEK